MGVRRWQKNYGSGAARILSIWARHQLLNRCLEGGLCTKMMTARHVSVAFAEYQTPLRAMTEKQAPLPLATTLTSLPADYFDEISQTRQDWHPADAPAPARPVDATAATSIQHQENATETKHRRHASDGQRLHAAHDKHLRGSPEPQESGHGAAALEEKGGGEASFWSLTDRPFTAGVSAAARADLGSRHEKLKKEEADGGKGAGGAEEGERIGGLPEAWVREMRFETILRGHSSAVTCLSAPSDGSCLLSVMQTQARTHMRAELYSPS
jgi:hypothetical protein